MIPFDVRPLPFFPLLADYYDAEVRRLKSTAAADAWTPRYREVLELGAQCPCWALFGSARNEALRPDVLAVLDAFYDLLIPANESTVNGYHTVGYLWHFSSDFRRKLDAAAGTASRLFLCPGDFGPEFAGVSPDAVGSPGCVTPPHMTQTVRFNAMAMMGNRGALFTPFGKGGSSELSGHREAMQIARWSCTVFTKWPEEHLPPRFLIDTRLANGWYFDSQRSVLGVMVEVGALYEHDLTARTSREVIIRVTGRRHTDTTAFPTAEEFETAKDAARFIYEAGAV